MLDAPKQDIKHVMKWVANIVMQVNTSKFLFMFMQI